METTEVQELKEMNIGRENTSNKVGPVQSTEDPIEHLPGVVNEGFVEQLNVPNVPKDDSELPPLTYVDFMPRCVGESIDGKEPEFAPYRTVMEQVNQWLVSMPQYQVFKVETVDRKLLGDMKLDLDTTIHHESSHGQNMYVRGIRVWIHPSSEPNHAVQQISYITVLPEVADSHSADSSSSLSLSANYRMRSDFPVPNYDTFKTTIEKLNRHLTLRPIQGKILNVETFPVKVTGEAKPDTEQCCWVDCSKVTRLFLYALRVYFVSGDAEFETIGYHDEAPDIAQFSEGLGVKVKYGPFAQVVKRTARWMKEQSNIRVINLQSMNLKVDKKHNGQITLNSNISGFGDLPLSDAQFVKILRTFYVNPQKSRTTQSEPIVDFSSRLFVPVRHGPKEFEAFSKTMQRAIAWLHITKAPLLGMETVDYVVHPDSAGSGVNEDKVDLHINKHTGRYHLTCIRLYFSEQFQEPPTDVLPTVAEDEAGWGCVIS